MSSLKRLLLYFDQFCRGVHRLISYMSILGTFPLFSMFDVNGRKCRGYVLNMYHFEFEWSLLPLQLCELYYFYDCLWDMKVFETQDVDFACRMTDALQLLVLLNPKRCKALMPPRFCNTTSNSTDIKNVVTYKGTP